MRRNKWRMADGIEMWKVWRNRKECGFCGGDGFWQKKVVKIQVKRYQRKMK